MADPFPTRSGLVRKAVDEVRLVLPPPISPRGAARQRSLQPSPGFEAILDEIGDNIGGSGFHKPIIRAVASFVAEHGRDDTDVDALYEVVRATVLAADRSGHTDEHVESMASRDHIVRAIETALVKFGEPNYPRRKSRQIRGLQPHYHSERISSVESSALLQRAVETFFAQDP